MSTLSFLDERAKTRTVEAVKAFEKHTCAELVVSVRRAARAYPEAHLTAGTLTALLALLVLLFAPVDFTVALMPLDVALAFAAGFGLSRFVPALGRLVTSAKTRRASVETAAKVAFLDLGVSHTKGRSGVLVFVSLFERDVAIVFDVGVTQKAREHVEAARAALEAAVARSDVQAFAGALEALGPEVGRTMPCAPDDVNELADEVA